MSVVVINPLDQIAARYGNKLAELGGPKTRTILARTLNAEGNKAKTRVTRELTKQTGLKRKVIVKAIQRKGASTGALEYGLKTKGGDIRAKHFGAREGKGGVTAKPRGQSTFYAQAFMKSGPKGRRRSSPKLHGHAFRNTEGRKWRGKMAVVRTGVFIPKEMVEGATRATWEATPPAIADQVGRQLAAVLRGF